MTKMLNVTQQVIFDHLKSYGKDPKVWIMSAK